MNIQEPKLYIDGVVIKIVDKHKYLGFYINKNLNNFDDIEKCEKTFYKQFYSVFRKFYGVDPNILTFLFKSYCTSFYGAELWHDVRGCSQIIKQFGIGYHKALKRIYSMSSHVSNHEICNICDILMFKHYVNSKVISFTYKLLKSDNACLLPHKYYFCNCSEVLKNVNEILKGIYGVLTIKDNDLDALKARIMYVQNHEDRLR